MHNPVTVEVTRGPLVESRHRGLIAVVDADGSLVWSAGDVEAAVFPRSACKAMQALPLVESGAAEAYGFGDRELALACSSHNGEEGHADLAAAMLARAGRDVETLECGAHWSFDQATLIQQARAMAKPTALHNNCSGKHAGFVCACCHQGIEPAGYVGHGHDLQRQIRAAMEDLTGAVLGTDNCGTDGCSIPTYAVPLKGLAHGFAKMATGIGLAPGRARAARRLVDACMAEPWYVAGTGRACTRLMEIAPGRIFVKTGAEGVFCAAIPERGLGIALKCEDGTTRAAEAMVAAVLARFLGDEPEVAAMLAAFSRRSMRNWNGIHVGDVRVTDALFT
ncbi:asparaginase [Rhizobiaceae bacterium BDR2-2]|uniref:Asparaginase n=1 Tax=Ectorhizobium quercum TaxID=2965071 RepID=A0AAE3N1P7_9HYPH|nr:asparaginase [Ectorhizobium quercum]MCX8998541.1 asparaginase [Ectorhizobium quercum]